MVDPIKVKIIIGSTRQGRFGEKPAQWIFEQIKNVEGVEAELLDLRDYPLPFFEEAISPSTKKEPYKNPMVEKWTSKIADGDAYIVVTPEYNHGYPAVLKNAFDYVFSEWNKKPIGFISYGSVGGARSVEQLRQVVVELQMLPIRNAINIFWSMYMEVAKETVGTKPSALDALKSGADRFIEQLIWWTKILKTAREQK
jgi:NAD(P)H-dependent FMN reductase